MIFIYDLFSCNFRAIVQKYLLEKSRICCQAKNERNYHVFYYLLAGATETEREQLSLLPPHKYHYLNQVSCKFFDVYVSLLNFAGNKNTEKLGIFKSLTLAMLLKKF